MDPMLLILHADFGNTVHSWRAQDQDAGRFPGRIPRPRKSILTEQGLYCQVDQDTGKSTGKSLRDTHEYVHPSARSRIVLGGPGIEDEGEYDCEALDPYKLKYKDETADKRPTAFWELRSRRRGSGSKKDLPESPLWTFEKELLRESSRMYDFIYGKSEDPQQR